MEDNEWFSVLGGRLLEYLAALSLESGLLVLYNRFGY